MWSCHLWQILNVKKSPGKDWRFCDSFFQAVTQNCESIKFFKDSIEWLEQWQRLNQKPREGVLTKETMTALLHTLKALIEISNFLLNQKKSEYVLRGKLQTDNLELRFGLYRRLAGRNYQVH